jgi:nucleoside-diphosphate-sugar epimerase
VARRPPSRRAGPERGPPVKLLVTGAGGFLGRAVLSAAEHRGDQVRAVLGPADADLGPQPAVAGVARVDLDGGGAADHLAELAGGVDAVVHLAGLASVASSFDDLAAHLRVHVGGTGAVIEGARRAGAGRLVYVSSAEVYGRPSRSRVVEADPPAPRSPYGAAKVGAEALVGAACRAWGFDAVVLRPSSIYGPGARRSSVLGTIVEQALAGGDVLVGDLAPVRDYCYVADVAEAVLRAAARPWDAAGKPREPLVCNIGSGTGTSVAGLAQAVVALVGTGARVALRDAHDRPGSADIPELVPDVSRAARDLGWLPSTPLRYGLRLTLDAWASEDGS